MNRQALKHILQNSYDRDQWISTLQFLTGKREYLTVHLSPKTIEINTQEADRIVKTFYQIGSLKTSDGISLPIFEIILEDNIRIEYNKVSVNDFIKKYIIKDAIKGALTTFSYDKGHEKKEWRFSFISKNSANDFFAEAEAEETNPKKYTYIFGTDEEHRTAIERLYNLEQSRFRLEDFFEAFNVEPVSKKFFEEYKSLYKQFSGFLADEKNEYRSIFEAEINDFNSKTKEDIAKEIDKDIRNFASRLMGRMVFLYFLQKKHWLGASNQQYKDGSSTFLSDLFYNDKESQTNFYQKYLSRIFFEALNTPDRKNEEFTLHNGKTVCIPFLNGGLFEEEQEPKRHREIQFPAFYFEDLFTFFNGYNFTIYENSPEEHTVAVDPEMLGHIFENLIDYNKDTGTFYTPKEIVQYMTQESLIEYLNTHLQKERKEIENLLKNHYTKPFNDAELEKIDQLLNDVKICDPAIGSGAFPMGMLQEIYNLKAVIAYELKKEWNPAQVKQDIIQNSIYGVDLDEGAVEIARLRFWLSLVVDEGTPKALPNLDYKIMQGNSLLESYNDIDLSNLATADEQIISNQQTVLEFGDEYAKEITVFDAVSIEEIQSLIKSYFTKSGNEKAEIKQRLNNIIEGKIHSKIYKEKKRLETLINDFYKKYNLSKDNDLSGFNLKSKELKELFSNKEQFHNLEKIENELISFQHKSERPYFLWHLYFKEIFDNGGFDIVIGNPPYIKEYTNKSAFDGFRSSPYYIGKMDIWYGFASKGFDILKNKGIECFIAQNNWITSSGASILRKEVLTRTEIKKFIDFGDYKVFQSAGIQTMIYLLQKNAKPSDEYQVYYAGLTDSNINKSQLEDFLNTNKTLSKERIFEKYQQNFVPANFIGNYISFIKPSTKNLLNNIISLGNFYLTDGEIAQGIVPNPDIINNRNILKIPKDKINKYDIKLNDGVFVVNKNFFELVPQKEKKYLHKIYEPADISKYGIIHSENYLIYISKNNYLNDAEYLEMHLEKYREIMDDRRENLNNRLKYFHLHWPRDEDFFKKGNKIISVRKCIEPTFHFTNDEAYVMMAINIIKSNRINLKYLTTFLNSKIVYYWLKNEGKMQGNNFQVDKDPLLKIPIYKPDNYSPFLELFELITTTLQSKENIIEGINNKHIANFFQEIVDACFFDVYFPEEMKEKNITVINDITFYFQKHEISKRNIKEVIIDFYILFSDPNNKVRNNLMSFGLLSPEVLGVIINS